MSEWGKGACRIVHGFSGPRLLLTRAFHLRHISSNLVGWAVDLDKLVPWLSVLLLYTALRSKINRAQPIERPASVFGRREWITVGAFGLLGAGLISWHYAVSPSGHWHSFEDKGLIDALASLSRQTTLQDRIRWAGLVGYRSTYLLLMPFVHFILFSATSLAALLSLGVGARAGEATAQLANRLRRSAAAYFLLACIPAVVGVVVHCGVAYAFGWNNFRPQGMRGWILAGLSLPPAYVVAIISGRFARQTGTRVWRGGIAAFLKGCGDQLALLAGTLGPLRSSAVVGSSVAALIGLFARPITGALGDAEVPFLNRSLGTAGYVLIVGYDSLRDLIPNLDRASAALWDDQLREEVRGFVKETASSSDIAASAITTSLVAAAGMPRDTLNKVFADDPGIATAARVRIAAREPRWLIGSEGHRREIGFKNWRELLDAWRAAILRVGPSASSGDCAKCAEAMALALQERGVVLRW